MTPVAGRRGEGKKRMEKLLAKAEREERERELKRNRKKMKLEPGLGGRRKKNKKQ